MAKRILYRIKIKRKKWGDEEFVVTTIDDGCGKTSLRTNSKAAVLRFLKDELNLKAQIKEAGK